MEKQLIRCIPARHFYDLMDGHYKEEQIGVYYGFDNQRADCAQIVELAEAIKKECPDIAQQAMDIQVIPSTQSARRTRRTMLRVFIKSDRVKDEIRNYMIL